MELSLTDEITEIIDCSIEKQYLSNGKDVTITIDETADSSIDYKEIATQIEDSVHTTLES